jgi:hypothetical protein
MHKNQTRTEKKQLKQRLRGKKLHLRIFIFSCCKF